MKYAASLGVATRREGGRNWRKVKDVRADCKVRTCTPLHRVALYCTMSDAESEGESLAARAEAIFDNRKEHVDWPSKGKLALESMPKFTEGFEIFVPR